MLLSTNIATNIKRSQLSNGVVVNGIAPGYLPHAYPFRFSNPVTLLSYSAVRLFQLLHDIYTTLSSITIYEYAFCFLSVGLMWLARENSIVLNVAPPLLVPLISMPLSFAVQSAFNRREAALIQLAETRSRCIALALNFRTLSRGDQNYGQGDEWVPCGDCGVCPACVGPASVRAKAAAAAAAAAGKAPDDPGAPAPIPAGPPGGGPPPPAPPSSLPGTGGLRAAPVFAPVTGANALRSSLCREAVMGLPPGLASGLFTPSLDTHTADGLDAGSVHVSHVMVPPTSCSDVLSADGKSAVPSSPTPVDQSAIVSPYVNPFTSSSTAHTHAGIPAMLQTPISPSYFTPAAVAQAQAHAQAHARALAAAISNGGHADGTGATRSPMPTMGDVVFTGAVRHTSTPAVGSTHSLPTTPSGTPSVGPCGRSLSATSAPLPPHVYSPVDADHTHAAALSMDSTAAPMSVLTDLGGPVPQSAPSAAAVQRARTSSLPPPRRSGGAAAADGAAPVGVGAVDPAMYDSAPAAPAWATAWQGVASGGRTHAWINSGRPSTTPLCPGVFTGFSVAENYLNCPVVGKSEAPAALPEQAYDMQRAYEEAIAAAYACTPKNALGDEFALRALALIGHIARRIGVYMTCFSEEHRMAHLHQLYLGINGMSWLVEALRQSGVAAPIIAKMDNTWLGLLENVERLRVFADYRTPQSIRSYLRIASICVTLIMIPYLAFISTGASRVSALCVAFFFPFILFTLLKVQEMLEVPYGNWSDDINIPALLGFGNTRTFPLAFPSEDHFLRPFNIPRCPLPRVDMMGVGCTARSNPHFAKQDGERVGTRGGHMNHFPISPSATDSLCESKPISLEERRRTATPLTNEMGETIGFVDASGLVLPPEEMKDTSKASLQWWHRAWNAVTPAALNVDAQPRLAQIGIMQRRDMHVYLERHN